MNKTRTVYFALAVVIGVFFIIFCEIDDSPGGQGLGLLFAVMGIVGIIKKRRKVSE